MQTRMKPQVRTTREYAGAEESAQQHIQKMIPASYRCGNNKGTLTEETKPSTTEVVRETKENGMIAYGKDYTK